MGINDSVGGMADKAKDALKRDPNRIEDGIDEAAEQVADKTDQMAGRKFSDKIDKSRPAGTRQAGSKQTGSKQARETLDKFGNQK